MKMLIEYGCCAFCTISQNSDLNNQMIFFPRLIWYSGVNANETKILGNMGSLDPYSLLIIVAVTSEGPALWIASQRDVGNDISIKEVLGSPRITFGINSVLNLYAIGNITYSYVFTYQFGMWR